MSATLLGAAFYVPLPKAEKLMLLALADHANDDGYGVWPGNTRLGVKTSDTPRNVRRILGRLEAAGLIARVANPKGGRGHAVEWALNVALIYAAAHAGGWTAKGKQRGRMVSPFVDGKEDTTDRKEDIPGTERGRMVSSQSSRSITTPGVVNMTEPEDPPLLTELHPRAGGESLGNYLHRIASLHRGEV